MTTGGVPFTEAPDEDNLLRDFLNSNNHGRGRSVSLPSTATNGELMFAFPTENREAREENHADHLDQETFLCLWEARHQDCLTGVIHKTLLAAGLLSRPSGIAHEAGDPPRVRKG